MKNENKEIEQITLKITAKTGNVSINIVTEGKRIEFEARKLSEHLNELIRLDVEARESPTFKYDIFAEKNACREWIEDIQRKLFLLKEEILKEEVLE